MVQNSLIPRAKSPVCVLQRSSFLPEHGFYSWQQTDKNICQQGGMGTSLGLFLGAFALHTGGGQRALDAVRVPFF